MLNRVPKTLFLTFIGLILLGVGFYLAITLGVTRLSFDELWRALFTSSQSLDIVLIRDVRLPRVIAAFFVGGILALCGAMFQGVTRNPIAEPSILGVSQGAVFVVAIFYAVDQSIQGPLIWLAAFLGALLGFCLLGFVVFGMTQRAMTRLLLAGTAISTLFLSLTTIIGLLSNQAQFIAYWVAGGLRNTTWMDAIVIALIALIGFAASMGLARKIDVVHLGDDVAIGLGVKPVMLRVFVLLLLIPLTAAAVAVGKNIAFVGLIVPQTLRIFIKSSHQKLFPFAFLYGGILVLFSDLLARIVFAPYELPIGVFTAILGVPFFLWQAYGLKG